MNNPWKVVGITVILAVVGFTVLASIGFALLSPDTYLVPSRF